MMDASAPAPIFLYNATTDVDTDTSPWASQPCDLGTAESVSTPLLGASDNNIAVFSSDYSSSSHSSSMTSWPSYASASPSHYSSDFPTTPHSARRSSCSSSDAYNTPLYAMSNQPYYYDEAAAAAMHYSQSLGMSPSDLGNYSPLTTGHQIPLESGSWFESSQAAYLEQLHSSAPISPQFDYYQPHFNNYESISVPSPALYTPTSLAPPASLVDCRDGSYGDLAPVSPIRSSKEEQRYDFNFPQQMMMSDGSRPSVLAPPPASRHSRAPGASSGGRHTPTNLFIVVPPVSRNYKDSALNSSNSVSGLGISSSSFMHTSSPTSSLPPTPSRLSPTMPSALASPFIYDPVRHTSLRSPISTSPPRPPLRRSRTSSRPSPTTSGFARTTFVMPSSTSVVNTNQRAMSLDQIPSCLLPPLPDPRVEQDVNGGRLTTPPRPQRSMTQPTGSFQHHRALPSPPSSPNPAMSKIPPPVLSSSAPEPAAALANGAISTSSKPLPFPSVLLSPTSSSSSCSSSSSFTNTSSVPSMSVSAAVPTTHISTSPKLLPCAQPSPKRIRIRPSRAGESQKKTAAAKGKAKVAGTLKFVNYHATPSMLAAGKRRRANDDDDEDD